MNYFLSNFSRVQKILIVLIIFLIVFALGTTLYLWWVNEETNKLQQHLAQTIEKYKAVNKNLKNVLPEETVLGTTQEGEKWIARLEKVKENLSLGKKGEAKSELLQLKSRIEFISESDGPKGYNYNLDKNKDGISDYTEGMYQGILNVLSQLR
ncbi:hypothetical protein KKE03_04415 [Patescibacteria group bacterium]|nr:hypothetical protein [Patescibacteria group bacterium]